MKRANFFSAANYEAADNGYWHPCLPYGGRRRERVFGFKVEDYHSVKIGISRMQFNCFAKRVQENSIFSALKLVAPRWIARRVVVVGISSL